MLRLAADMDFTSYAYKDGLGQVQLVQLAELKLITLYSSAMCAIKDVNNSV